ncbi:MAG TPA: helix-hairpin-helix domain-containing protein [Segetibacter sp.]|nr:helix-hairpin-helix domain-containing protein [Segetibacter sp.]
MKYWWADVVKDYFTFSAKERNGLIKMFSIAAVFFLFSRYVPERKSSVTKDAFQKELAELKIMVDSSHGIKSYQGNENYVNYSEPKPNEYANNFKREFFDFDPNTLDANGWKRLGVREKTVNTIQNFLAKGYKFRQPQDIKKIFGLRREEAARLIPYIHISQKASSVNAPFANRGNAAYTGSSSTAIKITKIIDINTADTTAFISLPGIGNKLAARIINFREKLGGFSSVNQLGETYGVPDSTFQRIKPRLQCSNPNLKKININTADISTLRAHPYLRWNIAKAIINYRQQHGNFASVNDIRKIDIITDELFNKISPYLVI